jgi:coenzyme F420-dependent glucose-6-phosphate dehydrogenase
MLIGYHASHEQFAPSELLNFVQLAEQAGFSAIKCSDHFHPWSEKQGQSGFAWSWLGAAMARSKLPFGSITAPGYRYHPAIVAQAIATLGEMFPERLWIALGSGQAINEGILGETWPHKAERTARLHECAEIIRRLLDGETVTHRGRVTVVEARIFSRPAKRPALLGAAVTPETAAHVAQWAEGMLTTGGDFETTGKTVAAFRSNGGKGKPVYLQVALSWAATEDAALDQAMEQWAPAAAGGNVNWELRQPADFDTIAGLVTPERIRQTVWVSSALDKHVEHIAGYRQLGVDAVYLHNVGTNQAEFIKVFGKEVLPAVAG